MHGTGRRTNIRMLLGGAVVGEAVVATGWIKTSRFSKNVSFVHLYDGSCAYTLQVVFGPDLSEDLKARLGLGAAIRVEGTWQQSPGGEQTVELLAREVVVVGDSDPATYPIQKKATSLEHLRTMAHLRPRSNTHQSVFRVRNALSWQIHKFFQERGFLWIHTPVLTGADAEGAGEMFHVSTGPKHPPDEFFGKQTYLTVSGQLEVECFAQSHTDVYTFGPTFRAENSNTARHTCEFWMIEPEIAFADINDVIALAEDFVRTVAMRTFEQCRDDFDFFDQRISPGNREEILKTISQPFSRVTYTEAQEILAKAQRSFEFPIGWGQSLQAEHERYLAEEHFKGPVFITDYPVEQKAFYMRLNPDGKTVACTDLVVPRIGEIIGGSQREEREDALLEQFRLRKMETTPLWWYLELRRWGTTPHGGFGLGLERMLMWLTGMQNIRDVLPFPRTPGSAEF